MPSVGMRRTTRVFGVVKAADGARVLRSGRRLCPNSVEPKIKQANAVNDRDWDCLLKDHSKSKGSKTSGRSRTGNKPCSPTKKSGEKDDKEHYFRVKRQKLVKTEAKDDEKPVNNRFGIVYSRKRKRCYDQASDFPDKSDETLHSLKCYSRRRGVSGQTPGCRPLLTLVVDWSCGECWLLSVLALVMRYVRREELRLSSLTAFFLSQPINNVYADHGIRFLLEPPLSSKGMCKVFGAVNSLPLLSVDFSTISSCFMDMHITLLFRLVRRSFCFVKKSIFLLENGESQAMEESDTDVEEAIPEVYNSMKETALGLHPSVRASKLTGGKAPYRGSFGSHSFQKTRSSLRRRRSRDLLCNANKLNNGISVSESTGSRRKRNAFMPNVSSRKLRSSTSLTPKSSTIYANEISTPKVRTKQELDSLSCSANILMIDSDKCTREEGFDIMLEFLSSKEWYIVIKKDGSVRFSHKAQKTMRPCSCNRFTHSMVWMSDDNWKLEFSDRQDWIAFKDIYKECYERNIVEQNLKVIPIPGVREVAEDRIDDNGSFSRPVSYISMKEDEISRAMASSSAIYDMDCEDEDWLKHYNEEICGEDKQCRELEKDTFELIIDGFEKKCFLSPTDDFLDEKAATDSLTHLGGEEVVGAVYDYWTRKRKKRKAPLLRVFQGYQAKKAPLLAKTVFRKRRSFKRQSSQLHGKAKQLSPLQVKEAEQEGSENQRALARVEEAKASADTSMEIAIVKRRRAQALAENADLAIYKAMMALRIAEAIHVAESSESPATLFFN